MIRFYALLLPACFMALPFSPSAEAAGAVHRVVIAKMAFAPSPPDLHAGDIVEWVNQDIFVHSATAADGSFDIDVQPNKTARVVIRKAGTINYSCKYHPGMQSTLVVSSNPHN
jgi:plastocyanin